MTLTEKNVNSVPATEPRKRRLPKDARENILAAAEAMLIAEGPQSLKLVEVARAAGVSNATVLHHFGSIDDVQGALMERMVRQLVDEALASTHGGGDSAPNAGAINAGAMNAGEGVIALFDAFERKGAARLAAWLELRGEARRLTAVRSAVREVIDARVSQFPRISVEALEDFMLASITMALAVGLFGSTLAELMDKPPTRAREVALRLLLTQMQKAISGG